VSMEKRARTWARLHQDNLNCSVHDLEAIRYRLDSGTGTVSS
jgi:hypothetical protein